MTKEPAATASPSRRRTVVAVVVTAALLAACGNDATTTTTADGTTTTSTTVATAPSYRVAGELTDLGVGEVKGVSADGSAAYVAAENPSSSVAGCEGMPAPLLYRTPLDGGARTPGAPPVANRPVVGEVLRRPGSSRVVLVDQCEEFLSGVFLATEETGGGLRDVKEVDERLFRDVAAFSLSWSAAGETLTGVRGRRDVVRIDPVQGTSERLAEVKGGITAVELADGTLALVTEDGVTVGSRRFDRAYAVEVAPDGRRLAFGTEAEGLVLLATDGRTTGLAPPPAAPAAWSPRGDAIAYNTGGVLRVVTLDGTVTDVADRVMGGAWFTPDGRALVFTRMQGEGSQFSEPHATLARFAS